MTFENMCYHFLYQDDMMLMMMMMMVMMMMGHQLVLVHALSYSLCCMLSYEATA